MFYKTLLSDELRSKNLSTIVASAKFSKSALSKYDGTYRWLQFALNMMGDAELPLYTETPRSFSNIQVSIDNDSLLIIPNIDYYRVCVMSTDDYGESYYKVCFGVG